MTEPKNKPGPGRPTLYPNSKLLPVYLSDEHIAIALKLGKNNRSQGIRIALELAKKTLKI